MSQILIENFAEYENESNARYILRLRENNRLMLFKLKLFNII